MATPAQARRLRTLWRSGHLEAIEPGGGLEGDEPPFARVDAGEDPLERLLRVRPRPFRMRVVGRPQQRLDAREAPVDDAGTVVPERHVPLTTYVEARWLGQLRIHPP